MSKNAPLLRPLGLNFQAKHSTASRVRPPVAGEARVVILNAAGAVLQEKLGHLSRGGSQCSVRFEGELHAAELVNGRWVYSVPTPPEDP